MLINGSNPTSVDLPSNAHSVESPKACQCLYKIDCQVIIDQADPVYYYPFMVTGALHSACRTAGIDQNLTCSPPYQEKRWLAEP